MRSRHNGEVADLIVVTGPPGAGKSTVGRILAGGYEASALVAGDQYFGFLDRGHITPWLPEADGQNTIVIEAAAAAAGRLAVAYMVVYDGAVGPWFESHAHRRWVHRPGGGPTTAGSERWRGLAR